MKSAVMNPHAMNAPILGMTMPLRVLPNCWICCRITSFLAYIYKRNGTITYSKPKKTARFS